MEAKPNVITKGNLEYRPRKTGGQWVYFPVLVRCPACGFEFGDSKGIRRATHIATHSLEDFGL